MKKSIIVARTINHVIGHQGKLPWYLPKDLQHFKQKTMGHHVIMGRKTFESLPHALPGRKLIILSQNPHYRLQNSYTAPNLKTAFAIAAQNQASEVFIAGGAAVYAMALSEADRIYLTFIHAEIKGDAFFPIIENHEWEETCKSTHGPDTKHAHFYDFIELQRRL